MFQKIETWIRKYYPAAFLAVLLIASFNLFLNLGGDPVKDWDEARHGITSAEMLHSGNWIKTTYLGETDYWNLKPPLGIWSVASSFAVFGINPFSLRFPSALSAWLCVLLVMLIAARKYSKTVAVFSGFILSMFFSFILVHSGRTGDFDAMMTLFVCLEVLFLTIGSERKNKIWFYLAVLTIPLAFLLKSFEAVIPFLILVLFLIFEKYYKKLNLRDWMLAFLLAALPLGLWASARYLQDGWMFLTQMAGYDLLKRSTTALEGHSASNFYYIEPFLLYGIPWTWLFLFFFFRGVKITRDKKKKFTGIAFSSYFSGALSWAWIAVPLAVVLLVTTKTSWYLDPVYPAIAVFTAWHLARFFSGLKNRRPADYLLPVFAGIVVVTEAVILAFNFTPVLSLSLNKGGDYAVLEKEILFQKLVLSIPTDMSGKNTIRIIPDGWTQSRLFCAMSMKGLVPIVSTNAAVYTIVMNGVSATNTPGERMSSNQSWSLYCIR